jgi:hypothetical protein
MNNEKRLNPKNFSLQWDEKVPKVQQLAEAFIIDIEKGLLEPARACLL